MDAMRLLLDEGDTNTYMVHGNNMYNTLQSKRTGKEWRETTVKLILKHETKKWKQINKITNNIFF